MSTKILIVVVVLAAFLGTMIWVIYHYTSKSRHNSDLKKHLKKRGYFLNTLDNKSVVPAGYWDIGILYGGISVKDSIYKNINKSKMITKGKKYMGLSELYGNIKTNELDYLYPKLAKIKANNWDGLCFFISTNPILYLNEYIAKFDECFATCKSMGLEVILEIHISSESINAVPFLKHMLSNTNVTHVLLFIRYNHGINPIILHYVSTILASTWPVDILLFIPPGIDNLKTIYNNYKLSSSVVGYVYQFLNW